MLKKVIKCTNTKNPNKKIPIPTGGKNGVKTKQKINDNKNTKIKKPTNVLLVFNLSILLFLTLFFLLALKNKCLYNTGLKIFTSHFRDMFDGNLFRADGLAFAVIGAVAETQIVHFFNHVERADFSLGMSLG